MADPQQQTTTPVFDPDAFMAGRPAAFDPDKFMASRNTSEAALVAALPNAAAQAKQQVLADAPGLAKGTGLYPRSMDEVRDAQTRQTKGIGAALFGVPATSDVTPEQAQKGIAAGVLAGSGIVAPAATALGMGGATIGGPIAEKTANALGAKPGEAEMWGTAGSIIGGMFGGEGGARLSEAIKTLPLSAQAVWDKITGYSKALDEAKNANASAYMLSEQKGAQSVADAQAKVTAAKAAEPPAPFDEWSRINQALGVPAKAIRIGRGASDLESAYGIPGRGLAVEGMDSATLAKMTPPEQAGAVGAKWQAAGKAVSDTVKKATGDGTTLDVGNGVFNVLKKIPDPQLQEKAIQVFNDTAQNLGIANQRAATPEQALALRQALKAHASFGPMGDLASLKGIGAQLYRAVSSDLHDAVPGLREVDMHYGDLTEAVSAIQKNVGKYMTGKWTPPQTTVQKAEAKVPDMPNVSPYTPLPSRDPYSNAMTKRLAGWGLLAGGAGEGISKLRALLAIAPKP